MAYWPMTANPAENIVPERKTALGLALRQDSEAPNRSSLGFHPFLTLSTLLTHLIALSSLGARPNVRRSTSTFGA